MPMKGLIRPAVEANRIAEARTLVAGPPPGSIEQAYKSPLEQ